MSSRPPSFHAPLKTIHRPHRAAFSFATIDTCALSKKRTHTFLRCPTACTPFPAISEGTGCAAGARMRGRSPARLGGMAWAAWATGSRCTAKHFILRARSCLFFWRRGCLKTFSAVRARCTCCLPPRLSRSRTRSFICIPSGTVSTYAKG